MLFSELTRETKEHAYAMYVQAMDDDLNREYTVSMEGYEAQADYDGIIFDEAGNVLEPA